MNNIKSKIFGAALFVLGALQANAVQVTAVTAQSGRVEGQSVEISAAVNWELSGPMLVNPLTGPFFNVSAQAGGQTIPLTFDSATGRYKGQFQNLLFDSYAAIVTATKTTRTISVPIKTTTVSATGQTSLFVGPPAGCFNFNLGNNLQGWTAAGMFDGDGNTQVVAANLIPTWNDLFGFRSVAIDNDGGLLLSLNGNLFPPNQFPSGFSRFDFRSPNLGTNANWQNIRGLSFRFSSNVILATQVQPILQIRKVDGTTTSFRPVDSTGAPIFFSVFGSDGVGFQKFAADIPLPAGATVLGVHLRVFHAAGGATPTGVVLDGVCPRR